VNGYKAKKAFMAKKPAAALCEVQKAAKKKGLGLKIYDGYRPVKAVKFFMDWAQLPETNPMIKDLYYPKFTRLELFERGFIAKQSSHSRGAAVDLTLYELASGKDLDMGSGFDYFDEMSYTETNLVTKEQQANRLLLKQLMESKGFQNFSQEWWHYSFKPEPFPGRSFDFDVE
jgi:D-alanyl-D-alanine dipeptidase